LGQYREKIKFVQDQLKKASEYSLKLKVGCPKKKCKVAFHYRTLSSMAANYKFF